VVEKQRLQIEEDDESGSRDGVWRYDAAMGWTCDLITDCQTKTVLLVYVFELDRSAADLAAAPNFFTLAE